MYHIVIQDKPKDCALCPLKNTETHKCGEIIVIRNESSGIRYEKKPNKDCKIKPYNILRR